MAKFEIIAYPCKFIAGKDWRGMTWKPLDGALARRPAEGKTPADVVDACQALADEVGAKYGGSFFVCHRLEKGQRAPNGYKALRFDPVQIDRCPA